MPKITVTRIELTGPAKSSLVKLSDRMGMTQVAMMSRLVEFFAAQDEMMQSIIAGRFPESIERDVARLILTKIR